MFRRPEEHKKVRLYRKVEIYKQPLANGWLRKTLIRIFVFIFNEKDLLAEGTTQLPSSHT